MPVGANVATELAEEHDAIEELIGAVLGTARDDPRRSELVNEVCARFLDHAMAEQRVVLPTIREYLPDGPRLAVRTNREIERAAGVVYRLAEPGALGADSFDELVRQLVVVLGEHVTEFDQRLLPMLVDGCPPEVFNHLGRQLRVAKEETHAGSLAQRARAMAGEPGDDAGDGNGLGHGRGVPDGPATDPGFEPWTDVPPVPRDA